MQFSTKIICPVTLYGSKVVQPSTGKYFPVLASCYSYFPNHPQKCIQSKQVLDKKVRKLSSHPD